MRAHGCPDGHEEGQQDEAVLVVRLVKISVHDQIGEFGEAAMPQVHEQEGKVVEHIDRRDLVVELDAVEQARRAVEQADVAQMQVAVAAAHLSGVLAPVEQRRMPRKRRAEGTVEGRDLILAEHMAGREPRPVDIENARHVRRATTGMDHRSGAVEAHDHTRGLRHQGGRQSPGHSHTVEQSRLVEPLHLDNRVGQFADAVEGELAARLADNAPDAEIDPGRGFGI